MFSVIDRWDGKPVQLELFADLPRIYCITDQPRYDAMDGTLNALSELKTETRRVETIVTVVYLTSPEQNSIEVYANGSEPTIERTLWLLQKAAKKMLDY